MQLKAPVVQVLADIQANKTPSPALKFPSATQSLLKRGLVVRSREKECGYAPTVSGAQALEEAQRSKR